MTSQRIPNPAGGVDLPPGPCDREAVPERSGQRCHQEAGERHRNNGEHLKGEKGACAQSSDHARDFGKAKPIKVVWQTRIDRVTRSIKA